MRSAIKTSLIAIFSAIVSSMLVFSYFQKKAKNDLPLVRNTPIKYVNLNPNASAPISNDFTFAAEQTTSAVVHIINMQKPQAVQYYNNPFFDFFNQDPYGRMPQQRRKSPDDDKPIEASTGSGVIISSDGYIVTNNHVVEGGDKIKVVMNDKREFIATIIGKDPNTDLALLKINENALPFLNFGNSDNTKVGEWVLAVGNPFNLTSTVTAGIISAKGRNLNIIQGKRNGNAPIESFIQTDAAVNPGNSGGALVNLNGELIGINTAIASQTGSYAGYAFAVPSNLAAKIVSDIKDFGVVQRGLLGVSISDISNDLAEQENINDKRGVYVASVSEGSAAKDAGIKKGDIIRKVDGNSVASVPELQERVGRKRPGDKVLVQVERNGDMKDVSVILKNMNGNTNVVKREENSLQYLLGASLRNVTEEEKSKYKIDGGVKIEELYSDGKLSNYTDIRDGFIITGIDKKPIKDIKQLEESIVSKKGGVLIDGIYPQNPNTVYYYGIGL